ncbi:sugar ABC transporter permease [Clostridia bacterium]|nr:sugar ABC transporter permease [Clostridia bacterium]
MKNSTEIIGNTNLHTGVRGIGLPPRKEKRLSRGQTAAFAFLAPALVVFALFKYYPIVQSVFISFFHIDIVHLPGTFVGLENYSRAFADPQFYTALLHNLYFWLVGLTINFWPPIVLALLINELRRGKTLLRLMYFIPAIAPAVAVSVLWKYIWQPDYGLANALLGALGAPPQMWLNNPLLTYWCIYFPGFVMAGGMTMLIYLASMQEVSLEMYEAAVMEGAGFLDRVRYITVPQIAGIIKVMFLLDVINKFNEMNAPLVMTGGGPMGTTQTLILYAFNAASDNMDYSYAITLANIVFAIVFIVTALQMKFSKDK